MLLSLQSTMLVSNSLFPFFNLQITDSGSYLGTSCRKCRGSLTADKPVEKMMTPGHQVVDRREDVDTETAADTNELMKQHELPVTFADALWHGIIEAVIYMPGELCFSLTLTQFALTILFSLPFLIMKPDTLCRLNIEPRHLEKKIGRSFGRSPVLNARQAEERYADMWAHLITCVQRPVGCL
jgi:hypothetical protein